MAELIKLKNEFAVRFRMKDEFGKWQRIYLRGFKTEKEALREAERIVEENNIKLVTKGNLTVEEFLSEWIYRHKDNIKQSTRVRYSDFIVLHIVPSIGDIKINKLNQSHLLSLYDRLKEKLSNKTIINIHRCLNVAFKQAVSWDYIDTNPVSKISPPRAIKPEIIIIEDNDLRLILDKFKDHESYIVFYMLACTGARAGEIAGLKYRDIDLRNKTITIRETLSKYAEDKGAKTESSLRTIYLIDDTDKELARYVKRKKLYNEYAFTWDNGKPFTVDFLTKKFKKTIRSLGLNDNYKLHSLRHTHVSNLIKQGYYLEVISKRLGHSSIKITYDTYSHLTTGIQKEILKDARFLKEE